VHTLAQALVQELNHALSQVIHNTLTGRCSCNRLSVYHRFARVQALRNQVAPPAVVWVVAGPHSVEVELLHQLDVRDHALLQTSKTGLTKSASYAGIDSKIAPPVLCSRVTCTALT
jgi:hypothetical protein